MPRIGKITVENADELLNAGAYDAGAVIRVQSGAAETGPFANLAGVGSTPTIPLVSGTRVYTFYDPTGTAATWYQYEFENAGATRLSGYVAAFQVGDEGAGLLCSLYDVKQRLGTSFAGTTTADEDLLEFISQTSIDIMGYTGRRFARNPLAGSTTFLFDVEHESPRLRIPQGIASITQLEVATQTGGAFSVIPTADWFDDPPASSRAVGWPATMIALSDQSSSLASFYPGKRVVRITGALGWAVVPGDVAGIAVNAVVRRWQGRGSGVVAAVGTDGTAGRLLRWISPEEREKLDWYRVPKVS